MLYSSLTDSSPSFVIITCFHSFIYLFNKNLLDVYYVVWNYGLIGERKVEELIIMKMD